jgi:hypothetical protein
MSRLSLCTSLAVLLFAVPAQAQQPTKPPEALLAKECLAYARFDGVTAHRESFDKTAFAELLRGETGEFLAQLGGLIQDSFGPDTVKQKLLAGVPPDQLMRIHAASSRLPQAINCLKENGVVLGFEYVSLLPPAAQLTIVFPNGSQTGNREAITAAFQLVGALNDFKFETTQLSGRTITQAKINEMIQWRWWQEGEHLVSTIGNATPDHTFSVVEGKRGNLLANPLFQATARAVPYETMLRGFIDAERALGLTKLLGKAAEQAFADLGLKELKSITFHLGGAGKHTRTSLIINTAGERKGLLKLLTAQPGFVLEPLPPLPPDAINVTALQLDLTNFYDTLHQIAHLSAGDNQEASDAFKKLNEALGLDLRKDVLETLGSRLVLYNSGGEGFMGMGIGLAVQVKDAQKLKESLDVVQASLPSALESNVSFTARAVAGATMHTIHMGSAGGPRLSLSPSYAVTDQWLYVGFFPQSVAGALHRRHGKLATWKPDPVLKELLEETRKQDSQARILAASQSDPRPVLRDLASIGPFFFEQVGAFSDIKIDAGSIPNYQIVTAPLFPNVGLIVDTGNAIRFETYSSVAIPFDPFGLHSYWFGIIIAGTL